MPPVSEYAPKTSRHQIGTVERLDSVPDSANNGADKDEEHGSVHSHGRASEHGVADVVLHAWSSHTNDDEGTDEGSYNT